MINNYTELKAEVADFIHRNDLDGKMDTFCVLAESQINKDLRAMEMEVRAAYTFTDTFTDLPADYLEMRSLEVAITGARVPIPQFTPQQLDQLYSRAQGVPRAFAIQAGQIEIRPGVTAPETFEGELAYFARVPSLIDNALIS